MTEAVGRTQDREISDPCFGLDAMERIHEREGIEQDQPEFACRRTRGGKAAFGSVSGSLRLCLLGSLPAHAGTELISRMPGVLSYCAQGRTPTQLPD